MTRLKLSSPLLATAALGALMLAAVGRPTVLLGVGSALGLLAAVFTRRLLGQVVYQADPGDGWVVSHWRMTGTHTGDWFGTPPTGRKVSITGRPAPTVAS